MKEGYIIRHLVLENANFITVANYFGSQNLVATYSFSTKKEMKMQKDQNDIGFWRIKRKETIK